MELKIEKIPNQRIAYIRKTGEYGIDNIKTMEELKKWANDNGLFNDESIILGIAQDNPKNTPPEQCRYDACIVVSSDFLISDKSVREGNIEGGKYAVFKIMHTAKEVQKAWDNIFPELMKQGYKLDNSIPILERYKSQLVNNHYCEICVPIQ